MKNLSQLGTYRREPAPPVIFFEDFLTGSLEDGHKISSSADKGDWLASITQGAGTCTINVQDDAKGGWLKILNGTADNDLANMQLNGESFKLDTSLNFEAKIKVTDVSETDWFVGLALADTDVVGTLTGAGANPGCTDMIGFVCPDSTGDIDALTIKDSTVTITDTGENLADATAVTLRIEYDQPKAEARFYVNGVKVATHTTNIPDDEALSPVFFVRNDGAVAQSLLIDYALVEQER